MEKISKFLEKFRNFVPRDIRLKNAVLGAVKETTGVCMDTKNVRISGTTVFLDISPNLKNLIFIKKEEILKKLGEDSNLSDFR